MAADHHSSRQSGRTASLHTAHTTASNRAGSTHTSSSLRLAPAIQGGPTSTALAAQEDEAVPGYSAPAADSSVSVGSNGYATEKKPAEDAGRGSSSGTPRAASVASGHTGATGNNQTSRPQSTTDRSEHVESEEHVETEETQEEAEERKEEDKVLDESTPGKSDF